MKQLFLILCACCVFSLTAHAETVQLENQVWYRIHFGMGAGKHSLTKRQFRTFLKTTCPAMFANGMTLSQAEGQWKSPKHGLIQEQTIVVDVNGDGKEACEKSVQQWINVYLEQFANAKVSVFVYRIPNIQTTLVY